MPSPPPAASLTEQAKRDLRLDYRLPGWGMHLQITIFKTKAAGDISTYFAELKNKANAIFAPHGLKLVVRDLSNVPLTGIDGPITSSEHIDEAIKMLQAGGDSRSHLKVVFCTRQTADSGNPSYDAGLTVRDTNRIPYILINMQASSEDRVTLAHEAGHAAGLHHDPSHAEMRYGRDVKAYLSSQHVDVLNNFMSDDNKKTRSDLFAYQVKLLGIASFATPGNIEG
jgi:hypothetical protein